MRKFHVVILILLAAGLVSCAPRVTPAPCDVKILRTLGWEVAVNDPQAEWNPATYQVLARVKAGFTILREGGPPNNYFSEEKREMYNAIWINERQFAFGPENNVVSVDGGRIVPPADGLTVVTVNPDRSIDKKQLSKAGCRPRVWNHEIVAQVEDKIVRFDDLGRAQEFDVGFHAEPQRRGPGICWQETPVFETDHWTAKPILGRLYIRWKAKSLSQIPNAVAARWTAQGGVVAIVLDQEPKQGEVWWRIGNKVVHIAGPKAQPHTIAENLHELAPHPTLPLMAATDRDGKLMLIDLAGRPSAELAPVGERPRWSGDGERLLAEEPPHGNAGGKHIKVYVLKFADPKGAP
jgi:hypothetical protein